MGEKFILNGEVYTGQGIGREFVHYSFDYNPAHPDGSTEISSTGGFASLKNQSFFLNFKHKITKKFGWGLEVISLTTNTAVGNGDARTNFDLKGER